MTNAFAIRFEEANSRFWIAIDGRELYELSAECVADSILAYAPNEHGPGTFHMSRTNDAERIISFGYCVEMCCPSISATVIFDGDKVRWTDIRHEDRPGMAGSYEFDRAQYEAEVNRVLIALVKAYVFPTQPPGTE